MEDMFYDDYADELIDNEIDEIEAAAEDVLCDDGLLDDMGCGDDCESDEDEYYEEPADEEYDDVDVQIPSYDIYKDNEILNYEAPDDTYDAEDYELDDEEDEIEEETDDDDIF